MKKRILCFLLTLVLICQLLTVNLNTVNASSGAGTVIALDNYSGYSDNVSLNFKIVITTTNACSATDANCAASYIHIDGYGDIYLNKSLMKDKGNTKTVTFTSTNFPYGCYLQLASGMSSLRSYGCDIAFYCENKIYGTTKLSASGGNMSLHLTRPMFETEPGFPSISEGFVSPASTTITASVSSTVNTNFSVYAKTNYGFDLAAAGKTIYPQSEDYYSPTKETMIGKVKQDSIRIVNTSNQAISIPGISLDPASKKIKVSPEFVTGYSGTSVTFKIAADVGIYANGYFHNNLKTVYSSVITVTKPGSITFRYHPGGGSQPDNYTSWTAKPADRFPDSHWNYTNGQYAMTRHGYTATGYYAKADGSCSIHEDYNFTSYADLCAKYGVSTTGTHTIDIYAQWAPNNYTVSFNANGGSVGTASKSVPYDSTYGTLPTPTGPTGYTFDGWYTAASGGNKVVESTTVKTAENHTLYAHWVANTYTITFDAQGGTTSLTPLPVIYNSNQNNKIDASTNPVRTDYTFNGWYTAPEGGEQVYQILNGSCLACTYWSGSRDDIGTGAVWQHDGNVTLYAQWLYTGPSTITFDVQGGTTSLTTLTTTYGSYANNKLDNATKPTKVGYTFDGWFDAPTGGSQVYKSSNGACMKGDYWTGTQDLDGYSAQWKGPKELTLYAHWIPNSYTVNFNANGGSVDTANKSVTYDSTYGTLPTPTRENHTFAGWFTAAESGTQVTSATAVKITATQTLYAHWNINTYTVTWKNYDGTVLETDTGVVHGTTPTYNGATPEKPEDENFTYTFDGWSPTVSAVTGDTEYTAQFTAVSKRVDPAYTVTIPATANEGESFTVKATGVVLNTDQTLTVTLQSDFTFRNEQGAELPFVINNGNIGNNAVILTITGNGDKNTPLAKDSDPLTVKASEEATYAGTYTGTVTFTIAVNPAENN